MYKIKVLKILLNESINLIQKLGRHCDMQQNGTCWKSVRVSQIICKDLLMNRWFSKKIYIIDSLNIKHKSRVWNFEIIVF